MSDDTETVARIWRQLGSPSYEALNGRSIHDLIDGLLADRQRLADVGAAMQQIDAALRALGRPA